MRISFAHDLRAELRDHQEPSPPLRSTAWTSAPRPKPWKIGRTARIDVALDRADPRGDLHRLAVKLAWESMIPLGSPVVPPSRGSTRGRRSPSSARGASGRDRRITSFHQRRRVGGHRRDLPATCRPEAERLGSESRRGFARAPASRAASVADLREPAVEGVERQRKARPAERQVVGDLVRRGERVDHRGDGAEPRGRVERDHALRGGRHRDGDPLACAEPQGPEPVRTGRSPRRAPRTSWSSRESRTRRLPGGVAPCARPPRRRGPRGSRGSPGRPRRTGSHGLASVGVTRRPPQRGRSTPRARPPRDRRGTRARCARAVPRASRRGSGGRGSQTR